MSKPPDFSDSLSVRPPPISLFPSQSLSQFVIKYFVIVYFPLNPHVSFLRAKTVCYAYQQCHVPNTRPGVWYDRYQKTTGMKTNTEQMST